MLDPHVDIAIHEDLAPLETYTCLDARTQEKDDKHVVVLKDEFAQFHLYKIVTENLTTFERF